MKIEIRNGRLIDPLHAVDGNASLFVADGHVVAIGDAPPSWNADRVVDATGLVVA